MDGFGQDGSSVTPSWGDCAVHADAWQHGLSIRQSLQSEPAATTREDRFRPATSQYSTPRWAVPPDNINTGEDTGNIMIWVDNPGDDNEKPKMANSE